MNVLISKGLYTGKIYSLIVDQKAYFLADLKHKACQYNNGHLIQILLYTIYTPLKVLYRSLNKNDTEVFHLDSREHLAYNALNLLDLY